MPFLTYTENPNRLLPLLGCAERDDDRQDGQVKGIREKGGKEIQIQEGYWK
jgi:hypothetical protein